MNLLSAEIIFLIFEYLPAEDLQAIGITCKFLHHISVDEKLPQRLMIPKLANKIIMLNALILWKYPEGNFIVSSKGKLLTTKEKSTFVRFFKYIKNDEDSLKRRQKVNKIVEITLQEIYRLNRQVYLNRKDKQKITNRADLACQFYIPIYSNSFNLYLHYPAPLLAKKIIASKQFGSVSFILKAAGLLQTQEDFYKRKNIYIESILPHTKDRGIIFSKEEYIKESLFQLDKK